MSKDLEIRQSNSFMKAPQDSRHIEGRAIVFESLSNDLGGFKEIIHRNAVTQELLDRSDVFARINHSDDYIMARSKEGQGSLKLSLRSDGVYYEFDAPNTEKGNELLEHLRRDEITQSSFAFSVSKDKGSETWEKRDGEVIRHIHKIGILGDVAPVWNPAYEETSVCLRALNLAKDLSNFSDFTEERGLQDKESKEVEETPSNEESEEKPSTPLKDTQERKFSQEEGVDKDATNDNNKPIPPSDDPSNKETVNEQIPSKEKKEEDEDTSENSKEENKEHSQAQDSEPKEDKLKNKESRSNNLNKNNIKMEKRFSLLGSINAIANNRNLDDVSAQVVNTGANEMRKAGLSFGGQIQIPTEELRASITVTTEGEDTVATKLFDVLGPLRAKNVLINAGAKFLTGLQGDIRIPLMSASNVTWEGEIASAKDGAGTFTSVKLSPKRLTAYVDISKQFLIQESVAAEEMIRKDIIDAINTKLESTILGNAAGTTTQPAGMFYGKTLTKVTDFAGVCNLESNIEDNNVFGECKYVMSNKAKAAFRNMAKSSKSTQLVMEGGEIDGTPVLNTSHVQNQNVVYGDWNNLAIGQWGAINNFKSVA